MGETPPGASLPQFVLDDIERQADEYGSRYKAALREAFGLAPKGEENEKAAPEERSDQTSHSVTPGTRNRKG